MAMNPMIGCLLIFFTGVLFGQFTVKSSVSANPDGCAAAGLCCQGKNISCRVVFGSHGDRNTVLHHDEHAPKTHHGSKSMCFCDSACLELNDCCGDYKTSCRPVDCVVSDDWSGWSECDARCGPGVMHRTRSVLQHPLNGGKSCPLTMERIACEGTRCKVARGSEGHDELRETAKIIPSVFGDWRSNVKYDPYKDIRRNLFERYMAQSKIDRPTYCMTFEFTEVWPACKLNDELNATKKLVEGMTVCVECQPLAMRKSLGTRCKGHGVMMKETRWKDVLVSGCHGKWILKSKKEECKCTKDQHVDSFILL